MVTAERYSDSERRQDYVELISSIVSHYPGHDCCFAADLAFPCIDERQASPRQPFDWRGLFRRRQSVPAA